MIGIWECRRLRPRGCAADWDSAWHQHRPEDTCSTRRAYADVRAESASTKMASLRPASRAPIQAPPSSTSSQVSVGASSSQSDPGANSIRSNTKCRSATSRVLSSDSRRCWRLARGALAAGGRDRVVGMQRSLSAVVEQAEGCLASLLDLDGNDSSAHRMDRTGRDENCLAIFDAAPLDQFGNGARLDRRPQFARAQPALQSQRYPGIGGCRENVPGLALPVRQTDRLRVGIAGMNLDRQRLMGK